MTRLETLARFFAIAEMEKRASLPLRNTVSLGQEPPLTDALLELGFRYRESTEGADSMCGLEVGHLWQVFCTKSSLKYMKRAPNIHYWWWLAGEAAVSNLAPANGEIGPPLLPLYGDASDTGKINRESIRQGTMRIRAEVPACVLPHLGQAFEPVLQSPTLFSAALNSGCLLARERYLYWNRLLIPEQEPSCASVPAGLERRTLLSSGGKSLNPLGPCYGIWDEQVFVAVPPQTPPLAVRLSHGLVRRWDRLGSLPAESLWWTGTEWRSVRAPIPNPTFVYDLESRKR